MVALDAFLAANDYLLGLLPNDMYDLAIQTAAARANKITPDDTLQKILDTLKEWAISFDVLATDSRFHAIYEKRRELRRTIRTHKLNQA